MDEDPKTWASFDWGGLLSAATIIGFSAFLLFTANVHLSSSFQDNLNSLGSLGLGCCVAVGLGVAIRYLFPGKARLPHPFPPTTSERGAESRERLARYVVLGGASGIVGTALILIVSFATTGQTDWPERGMTIFTSTLPVFSTWVGTVLTFYFTNESYRTAAAATQTQGRADDGLSVTRAGTMIPYAQIVRYDMKTKDINNRDPKVAAAEIPADTIAKLFSPPGIIRIVIFDDKQIPVYVIRHDKMFDTRDPAKTLQDYLIDPVNKTAAGNFAWTSQTASINDVRRLIELRKVTDVFITQNGRSDEPTMGWVPDTNVNQNSPAS